VARRTIATRHGARYASSLAWLTCVTGDSTLSIGGEAWATWGAPLRACAFCYLAKTALLTLQRSRRVVEPTFVARGAGATVEITKESNGAGRTVHSARSGRASAR